MNDKYDKAGILIRPTVKLESDMEQPENEQLRKCAELKALRNIEALSPIPAQQSQVATSDKVLFNGSHGHAGYVIEEQQSPAVAVPDEIISAINELRKNIRTEGKSVSYCGIRDNDSTRDALEKLFSFNLTQSPRITEQDALPTGYREEWKRNVMLMWSCVRKHDSSIPSDVLDYMREQLLNKLNKVNHETN